MIPLLFSIALIALILYWLLIVSEGVYLGRRVVIWLYDRAARRYDRIKQFNPQHDHATLAVPLLKMTERTDPLVLDVATGTGRLPLALLSHRDFDGHIIGLDLSRAMLAVAAEKLNDTVIDTLEGAPPPHVSLIWESAERLPFIDDAFDAVTCLEALEFTPDPAQTLHECVRVLRPDGVLLITNRIGLHGMIGRTWSERRVRELLNGCGIEAVRVERWTTDYVLVWGKKILDTEAQKRRDKPDLIQLLRCARCAGEMREDQTGFVCIKCDLSATIAPDGVIEMGNCLQA